MPIKKYPSHTHTHTHTHRQQHSPLRGSGPGACSSRRPRPAIRLATRRLDAGRRSRCGCCQRRRRSLRLLVRNLLELALPLCVCVCVCMKRGGRRGRKGRRKRRRIRRKRKNDQIDITKHHKIAKSNTNQNTHNGVDLRRARLFDLDGAVAQHQPRHSQRSCRHVILDKVDESIPCVCVGCVCVCV